MSQKKKIVHIINTLERGGAEMSLLRMLPLLHDDFENVFITIKQKGSLAEKAENHEIQVISINQKNPSDISSLRKLKKTLQEISPDLVVTHLLYPDIIGRFFIQLFLPCKVISSIVTTYNSPHYWAARLFERLTHHRCVGYIANANTVKDTYVKKFHVPEEKITVLPTGMDTEAFAALRPNENLRHELGIQSTDTVIICVANLHPNKGHYYLLCAFEEAYKNNKNIKLLIVGDGIEKENLLKQVEGYQSKDAILFLGKRSDVPDLLALSDIFALATFFEGMSNAIMEAMAAGLPIITTDIPENQELVTHKKTGLLCPLKDSKCLTQALVELINNKESRLFLGKNAAQEMKKKYNLQITKGHWKRFFLLMSEKQI